MNKYQQRIINKGKENDSRIVLPEFQDKRIKEAANQLEVLTKLEEEMNRGVQARDSSIVGENHSFLKDLQLITIKPCLYVANVVEEDKNNPYLSQLEDYAKSKQDTG